MSAQFVFSSFTVLTVVGSLLTVLRIWRSGLAVKYPWLTAYLIFLVPDTAAPLLMDMRSGAYYHFWMISEPMTWILEALLIRELCKSVLAQYPGLYTMGRWLMCGGILLSTGTSLLALQARFQSTVSARSRLLALGIAGDRGVNLALAVFLLLMLFLVSRYPVPLSRNVLLNTAIFSVFFLSNTLGATLHWIFDLRLSLSIDASLAATSCICSFVWLVYLTPAGEILIHPWRHVSDDQERHLLGQLDMLNRMLLGRT
jgi:hypothetical protein